MVARGRPLTAGTRPRSARRADESVTDGSASWLPFVPREDLDVLHRSVALLAFPLLAGLVACGTASDPGAPPASVPAVQPSDTAGAAVVLGLAVRGGAVSPARRNVDVPLGATVRLLVTRDVADEVHVHGYDVAATVPAGGTASLELVADQSGTFEVETHETELLLAKLVVS